MCSATLHLGGNITKSAIATPGFWLGHVKTVKIEGSWRGTKISIEKVNGRNDMK